MRIAVTHVYSSKNKGDAAILLSQLKELDRVFPGAAFEIMTLARSTAERDFEGRAVERSLMSTVVGAGAPRPVRPLLGVSMMALTTLRAALQRVAPWKLPLPQVWERPMRALESSDLQVCVGGGYLRGSRSAHSTYLLALLVHQIALGYLLGKPVYLYAQSFGPFYSKGQRWLFDLCCACSSLALARESISYDVASRATRSAKVTRVTDTAFLTEPSPKVDLSRYFPAGVPERVVGVTARQWLSATGQGNYERALAEVIRSVLDRGWGVLVIPQVTAAEHGDDDREVGRRLKQSFADQPSFATVEDDLSIGGVLELYGALDYLIGTRFHSVIFCLCQGVPCVAIEYEHKTSGILRDMGLAQWCVSIESVSGEQLCQLFDALVEQRDQVVAQIAQAVTQARVHAQQGADAIAQHYRSVAPAPLLASHAQLT